MSQPLNNQQLPINNHQPTTSDRPLSPDAAVMAYQAYQETMRQFLRVQESVMQQFLGGTSPINQVPPSTTAPQLIPQTPPSSIPSPPPIPLVMNNGNGATDRGQLAIEKNYPHLTPQSPIPSRSSPITDGESLTQTLLNIVSDRTGYPQEMLGLDRDLEAELGIDSIKRVEILGALGKVLPEAIARSIPTQMETLTRVKTQLTRYPRDIERQYPSSLLLPARRHLLPPLLPHAAATPFPRVQPGPLLPQLQHPNLRLLRFRRHFILRPFVLCRWSGGIRGGCRVAGGWRNLLPSMCSGSLNKPKELLSVFRGHRFRPRAQRV